jgi:hypothetical protein
MERRRRRGMGRRTPLSVKLEYLHVDLGSETDAGASTTGPAIITHMHSLTEDIARLGVNYRLAQ